MKHRIVFAPAGSGKTELLSQRYLELIKSDVAPERILTLTFTEKAAAEMKERILANARKQDYRLYQKLRDSILKLRISTIHSFCFSLVRRFADLLNLEPHLDVATNMEQLWLQAKYDTLMKIAEKQEGFSKYHVPLISLITRDHTNSWQKISRLLDLLFYHRTAVLMGRPEPLPLDELSRIAVTLKGTLSDDRLFPSEFTSEGIRQALDALEQIKGQFLRNDNEIRAKLPPDKRDLAQQIRRYLILLKTAFDLYEFEERFSLFRDCFLKTYTQAKMELGLVDYEDMEYFALKLLTEIPEWQNILFIFDEHTDHILVDEFQDTSYLQWEIINKLIEEWRAGEGVKYEKGINPTVFIVGDDQQSIYMFRNVRVEIFFKVQKELERWFGKEKLETITIKENYRSLPAIIEFNNYLFSRLMSHTETPEMWRTSYKPFLCQRAGGKTGLVELLIEKALQKYPIDVCREKDALNIARRIKSLLDSGFQIFERQPDGSEVPRPCRYKDIAILIRKRDTFLTTVEEKLREFSIPFLVVGGTGFYEEKEIKYLSTLTSFLTDPADDMALYITLRGPFFKISEKELLFWIIKKENGQQTLWERLKSGCRNNTSLIGKAIKVLEQAIAQVNYQPFYLILDRLLIQAEAYRIFYEPQRVANIKKFLQLIQELEFNGAHPLRIKTFLEQGQKDESKADVATEDMDAVQIMTVHSAKGLQFPIVFHPGVHEKILSDQAQKERLVVEETNLNNVMFSYLEDKDARNENKLHREYRERCIEEEKRVFYVACTRARDALFLTGVWSPDTIGENRRFWWLQNHLGLKDTENGFQFNVNIPGVCCRTPEEIPLTTAKTTPTPQSSPQSQKSLQIPSTTPEIKTVTKYLREELVRHSAETIGAGEIIHRLLELIANGSLMPDSALLEEMIFRLLRISNLPLSRYKDLNTKIIKQIQKLINTPECWAIIRPQPDSFVELPFFYCDGEAIWTGRIDRVILRPSEVGIYDYKTFLVKKSEIPELKKIYHERQLVHYARACAELFPGRQIKTFLVFTYIPQVIQT